MMGDGWYDDLEVCLIMLIGTLRYKAREWICRSYAAGMLRV